MMEVSSKSESSGKTHQRTAVVIRGGGSQGAVILDHLRHQSSSKQEQSEDIDYFVWDDGHNLHPLFANITKLIIDDNDADALPLPGYASIHVYIAVGDGAIRKKLFMSVQHKLGPDPRLVYPTFIHSTAIVSTTARIQEGCFIGPGAIINTCACIGKFVLVNTYAIVEHDCIVEDYVTMNPSSALMGCVTVASFVTIGANAVVRDHCSIKASGACIGMGAAVVGDILDVQTPAPDVVAEGFWAGVPAKLVLPPVTSKSKSQDSDYRGKQDDDTIKDESCTPIIRWCFKKPLNSENFIKYLQPSLAAGHLTNDGPLQAVLASRIKHLVRSKNSSLLTCSGTAALHALCAAWSLKENKRNLKWVTQAFTFPSSIQGPLHGSFVADLDPEWLGPSRAFLEDHLSEFDGVIVTNVFGLQTNVGGYESWCRRHKKILIFDNAATPLGFVKTDNGDDGCGSSTSIHDIGNGSIISFHETKPFGRGEGGAVFATEDVLTYVHRAMNYGYEIPKGIRIPHRACSNWRMSELAAAAILDHFNYMATNQWEDGLNKLAKFAVNELDRNGLALAMPIHYPTILSCLFVRHNRHGQATISSKDILKRLHAQNIEAKHYYAPLCKREDAPEAWNLFDSTVCLPFHLGINEDDITNMIAIVTQTS